MRLSLGIWAMVLLLLPACGIGGPDPGPRVFAGTLSSQLDRNETISALVDSMNSAQISLNNGQHMNRQVRFLSYEENGFRVVTTVDESVHGTQGITITGLYRDGRTKGPLSFFLASDSLDNADPDALKSLTRRFHDAYRELSSHEYINPEMYFTLDECIVHEGDIERPCNS